jgi:hypothetical protein
MRELTKSTLSAGLAMSLFGMQTMRDLVFRRRSAEPRSAQEPIDTVTQALLDNTSKTLREVFQAGDKIQRGLVDITARFATMGAMRPNGGMSMPGAARQATEQFRAWMGDMNGRRGGDCGCAGSPSAGSRPSTGPWVGSDSTRETSGSGWSPMPD